jgi:hypothetical protein
VPTIKLKAGANAATAKAAKIGYTGSRPPKGLYRVLVKRLSMTLNKNEDFMLNAVLEIDEPKNSPKAKYNGYGFWWNGNCTEEGAGYINQFLDSITGGKKEVKDAFWGGKIRCFDAPKKGHKAVVQAIGPLKIQQEGMKAVVNTRLGKPYNGEQNLAVADWLLPSQAALAPDSDEQEDDAELNENSSDEADVEVEQDGSDDAIDDDSDEDDGDDGENDESIEYTDEDEDGEPPF